MSKIGASGRGDHIRRPQLFLSHASRDVRHVEMVSAQLEAMGVHVYLAEHDPLPGVNLADKVRCAIADSDAVVILLTTLSVNSSYVHQEIGVAIEQGKRLIPIVETGLDRNDLAMLEGKMYVALDPEDPATSMAEMAAGVRRILESMEVSPQAAQPSAAAPTRDVPPLVQAALFALIAVLVFTAISGEGSGS